MIILLMKLESKGSKKV